MKRPSKVDAPWLLAGTVIAAGAGLCAGLSLGLIPLTLFGLILAAAFLVNVNSRATALCTAGILLVVSSSSHFLPGEVGPLAVGTRLAGLSLIGWAAIYGTAARSALSPIVRRIRQNWLIVFAAPVALYVIFATLPHRIWSDLAAYSLGSVLLIVMIVAVAHIDSTALVRGGVISLFALTLGSILAGGTISGLAIEQGRLRGLVENANTLGFFAFLLGALTVLLVKNPRAKTVLLFVTVLVLLWSASRASAIALAVLLGLHFLRRPVRAFVVGCSFGAAVYVAMLTLPRFESYFEMLLRDNNSRVGSWAGAMEVLESSPLIGLGMGNEPSIVASSPLRALSNAGLIGLVLILVLYAGVLILSARIGARTFAFAAAAVVHSLAEAWLLSPVSPLLLVFVYCWWSVAVTESTADKRATAALPTLALTAGQR